MSSSSGLSSWTFEPLKKRHYDPYKRQLLFRSLHNATSRKTWVSSNTVVRNSNLASIYNIQRKEQFVTTFIFVRYHLHSSNYWNLSVYLYRVAFNTQYCSKWFLKWRLGFCLARVDTPFERYWFLEIRILNTILRNTRQKFSVIYFNILSNYWIQAIFINVTVHVYNDTNKNWLLIWVKIQLQINLLRQGIQVYMIRFRIWN